MKVQIVCRNIEEAKFCFENNVDCAGLLVGKMHVSEEFISPELAKEIVQLCPPFCTCTLITHLEKAKDIIKIIKYAGFTIVQLHSYINEKEVAKIRQRLPYVKILRLIHIDKNGNMLNNLPENFIGDAVFTDSINIAENRVGGTGLVHDFNCDAQLVKNSKLPVIIAGGLNASNVKSIIEKVKPWGVDCNSGCATDRKLDKSKTIEFIKAIRG